jgi:general secretion pathway protein A
MYTHYFGLRENPFALPPDPRYLYMSRRHQEALAHLLYGISQGSGFVQLTGEVGTGKTMIIRAMLERLPPDTQVALVLYPLLSVEEFVASVCDDLRIPRSGDGLKTLIDTLNVYLLENHAKGRRTVLIIDEAHKLSHAVLEQVRLLTNLETTKEKLLQILLIGQPELINLLRQPDLRQLAQRITARYNLQPLSPSETSEYVSHRLHIAGAQNPIFTRSGLAAVHRLSGGTPRLINAICDRALLGAYARGKNQITGAIVRQAASEIGEFAPRRVSLPLVSAVAAAVLLTVGGWQWFIRWGVPGPTSDNVAVAAAPVTAPATVPNTAPNPPSLAALLGDPALVMDTDAAFTGLFSQWRRDYNRLSGDTGCERAQRAGLDCLYTSGTWNNLRQLNRPAVIELIDPHGRRRHVLVSALQDDRVVLDIGGQSREFPLSEVERYWYGKFLTLWMPPPSGEAKLRRGTRGPAVVWLRGVLARYAGQAEPAEANDIFDARLEEQVKQFQRRHYLDDDGVVGRSTLIHLDAYNSDAPAPFLVKTAGTR